MDADVAELFEHGGGFRRETVSPDEDGFIHSVLPHGGNQEENAPEIIDVADSDDGVVFHAASLLLSIC